MVGRVELAAQIRGYGGGESWVVPWIIAFGQGPAPAGRAGVPRKLDRGLDLFGEVIWEGSTMANIFRGVVIGEIKQARLLDGDEMDDA